jgi:hypothetical protein
MSINFFAVSVTFCMVLVIVNQGKLICVSSRDPWHLPQSASVNSPNIIAFTCIAVALVSASYSTKVMMWQIKIKAPSLFCKFVMSPDVVVRDVAVFHARWCPNEQTLTVQCTWPPKLACPSDVGRLLPSDSGWSMSVHRRKRKAGLLFLNYSA